MKNFRPWTFVFFFCAHLALHQRAMSHWISSTPPESTEDERVEHSEAFENCNHVDLREHGSQRFEWLSNGSVYFPTFGLMLNSTDFIYNSTSGSLHVCQEVLRKFQESGRLDGPPTSESTRESTSELNTTTVEEVEYSDTFENCSHTDIPQSQGPNGPRYKWLPNGSVYFPAIDYALNRTDFYFEPINRTLYVCMEVHKMFPEPPNKFPGTLSTVTLVGTALSTVCIVLHIAMFLAFKKLRNLPGYTLCSLCVALLGAYACVFAGEFLPKDADCTAVGLIKAYSFMAAFLWMNVMSFDIWRSLRMATNKLRLTADRGLKRRLGAYSAYAWGVPLGVLGVAAVVHHSPGASRLYRLDIDKTLCWFQHRNALLAYFAAPIFATIAANVLLFVASFVMIRAVGGGDVGEQRSRLVVSVRLSVAMGLVWVFAVLAVYTNQLWLSYLSVLATVLQGVFIFFSFSFTDKMKQEVRRAVQRRKDSSYPTSVQQMSTSA